MPVSESFSGAHRIQLETRAMIDTIEHATPEIVVGNQLSKGIQAIEKSMKADAISIVGSLVDGVDVLIRNELEVLAEGKKTNKLVVIIQTPGGIIEVVQRIVETLRYHYEEVEFIIPNFAMSAGTVLVMSGDAIHMDYFSVLGPIDPQVVNANGQYVPALGYLDHYSELIQKSRDGELTTAEMNYLIENFDSAELYQFEQARLLSINLLKDWLVRYKFKNWTKTESRGVPVTNQYRTRRATSIAKKLSNSSHWHSHGRGISMEVLRRDLNLQIEDFGQNPKISYNVRTYNSLLIEYMRRCNHHSTLHTRRIYVPVR